MVLTYRRIKEGLAAQARRLPEVISPEDAEVLLLLLSESDQETTLDEREVFEDDTDGIALQTAARVIAVSRQGDPGRRVKSPVAGAWS